MFFPGVKIITDNNPLTYVLTTAKLDATGHRWLAALSTYNFRLEYRKGTQNGDADGLSRRPHSPPVEDVPQSIPEEVVKAIAGAHGAYPTNWPAWSQVPLVETLALQGKAVPSEVDGPPL